MFEKIRDAILIVCTVSSLFGIFLLQTDMMIVYKAISALQDRGGVNSSVCVRRDED